jgi:hypothetical protein
MSRNQRSKNLTFSAAQFKQADRLFRLGSQLPDQLRYSGNGLCFTLTLQELQARFPIKIPERIGLLDGDLLSRMMLWIL